MTSAQTSLSLPSDDSLIRHSTSIQTQNTFPRTIIKRKGKKQSMLMYAEVLLGARRQDLTNFLDGYLQRLDRHLEVRMKGNVGLNLEKMCGRLV